MNVILGSASKARQAILKQLGHTFEVLISDIDEKSIRHDDFYKVPLLVSKAKSEALLPLIIEPSILITCDSVIIWNGQLREKPINENEAAEFLRTYWTHPAEVVTGVTVVNTKTGKKKSAVDVAKVFFHKIPEDVISILAKNELTMNWAGGFSAEHQTIKKYIIHIEGTIDSVMGLPKKLTQRLIEEMLHAK